MTPEIIWNNFQNLKYKEFILELLVEKYQRLDRNVNIFLALTSSSSIAAWAVWKDLPFLWGSIIAASQVVTTIKPFFPYYKIAKVLNTKCLSLTLLNNEYQRFLIKVLRGTIPQDLLDQNCFDFNQSYAKLLNFSEEVLFEANDDIEKKATDKMNVFFRTNFNAKMKK